MKLKFIPSRYEIFPELKERFALDLALEWRRNNNKGEPLFCIKVNGNVMHKDGSLEYESLPSSRTEEFLKNTRFTLKKAQALANKHIPKYMKKYFAQPHTAKFLKDHENTAWAKEIKKKFNL